MCNRENLPARVDRANAAQHFAKIEQRDARGLVRVVSVPGSQMRHYRVIIRRNGTISTELNLVVNGQLQKPKYAAQVTYHQMAALQVAAQEARTKIVWCASEGRARRLSNIKGTAFRVVNHDNPHEEMWGVYRDN